MSGADRPRACPMTVARRASLAPLTRRSRGSAMECVEDRAGSLARQRLQRGGRRARASPRVLHRLQIRSRPWLWGRGRRWPVDCYGRPVTVPRWLLRIWWAVHKGIARLTGGRIGTLRPSGDRLGVLFLTTVGRTTGRVRRNGLFYIDHAAGYVVVASNAGAEQDPAWWRNLQARPDATVEIGGREIPVHAREVPGQEHDRLYARFEAAADQFRTYREQAGRPIPVILLERRDRP